MFGRLCAAGALAVIGAMVQFQPAGAQNLAQAWDWCVNKDRGSPDLQIGGCTAVIQSGRLSRENLSGAFNNRGNAYLAKQDFDRAIGDYDQAIALDSRNAFAFHNRGLAYFNKQNYDSAIADYSRAIQLNSKFADAFNDRGVAYHAKGDDDHAIAEYDEAIKLNPNFTLAINNRNAAVRAKAQLAAAAKPPNDGKPPNLAELAAQGEVSDRYRDLQLFSDVFEKVRTDYVKKIDEWTLVQGAIDGLKKAPGVQASALDEQQLCRTEMKTHTASSALICFGNVFDQANKTAPAKLQQGAAIESAIGGMVSALDPHSNYISAKAFRDAQVQSQGEFGGVGVEVSMDNNLLRVVAPIDGTPAARAGLMANDIIAMIDDEKVSDLTLTQAVEKMRGPINSTVKFAIRRKGSDKPIDVTMTREVIRVKSVRWHAEGDAVGYVRISQFNEQTTDGLKSAISGLKDQLGNRIKGFIVDLRNDPGGLLDQAISVSDTFLERGEILATRGRDPAQTQRFNARPGDAADRKPLIVLINGGSAAASEIVVGALQDHKRATVIGSHSFGEGSVQTIIPLGAGEGALRMTTALFYRPSGRQVQTEGITPDIEVLQDVPKDSTTDTATRSEASLTGHLEGGTGSEAAGSQSYVPPDEKDDKALQLAIGLLLGQQKNPAFPAAGDSQSSQ